MGSKISGWLKATVASVALVAGIASGGQGSLTAASNSAATPGDHAPACGTPAAGHARCGAIELLNPSQNWHPGPNAAAPSKKPDSGSTTTAPSGYYPADLQSAYNLASALKSMTKPGGATIAVVDAYNDPYAATDLATYRSTMSGATDPSTKLTGTKIPPLCSSTITSGCVTFKKVNQSGGTSYPKGNTGWGEEISLDLDMISAICPNCNITLVEASSSSFSNLNAAVAYAKSLHPAAVTNSYGGSEFSSETSYNANYSYSSSSSGGQTAVTAATGDSGYGVEFPAAAPNLTAVGGTSLTYTGTGATLAWNPQTVWSGAGAGCSAYETMPSWQDTSAFDLSSVCASRQVGDVSAVADPNTGVAVYDTYSEPGWMVFGGTSASTQIIGAMYGLAAGAGVEQPSPAGLYQGTGVVAVTSGSDGSCGSTYLCQAGTGQLSSGYAGPVGVGVPDGIGAFSAATAGSLSFSPSSETATAGQPTGSLTVNLSAPAPSGGVTVNLATSSSGGGFSTSPTGSFSHTLSLTVAGGDMATEPFYYEDTVAGTPTVTASATGWTTGSLSVTVDPGPLASITVSPSSATLAEGATQTFTATGVDSYGNVVGIDPSWTTTVSGGAVGPSSGSSTTFIAGSTSDSGTVTAAQNGVSGSASVTVSPLASMTVSVTNGSTVRKGPNYRTPVTVAAADATTLAPLSGANVALDVFSGSCSTGTLVSSGSGTTGSNGQVTFTFTTKSQGTYCAVATATYSGYSTGTSQDTFTN
ncbi:MAG: hypothetical protein M1447_08360 [Gammaproteobacteria bacterium]|jgi:hypothetical protein|nr:hypothetical protein [Gammaproteobacteria bacterium]